MPHPESSLSHLYFVIVHDYQHQHQHHQLVVVVVIIERLQGVYHILHLTLDHTETHSNISQGSASPSSSSSPFSIMVKEQENFNGRLFNQNFQQRSTNSIHFSVAFNLNATVLYCPVALYHSPWSRDQELKAWVSHV